MDNEAKQHWVGFLSILLGILHASLLGRKYKCTDTERCN